MSDGIPYADIVVLALIAGFILLRLRGVLGQNQEDDSSNLFSKPQITRAEADPVVVQLNEKLIKPKSKEEADPYLASLGVSDVADNLQKIKDKDPQFSATEFLTGAKRAFEMVFDAFVKGDKNTLKMLLSEPLYKHFSGEIDTHDGDENKHETTLVAILTADITEAKLAGSVAQVHVKLTSEQVSVVRGKDGQIVEGDPSELHHIEDEWVFERDTTSKNPNWKIIET